MSVGGVVHAEHDGQRRQALAAFLPQFAVALFVSQRAAQRGAPGHAPGVARFSFSDLCARPLGAADYMALARRFHTLIVSDVPVMGEAVSDLFQGQILIESLT